MIKNDPGLLLRHDELIERYRSIESEINIVQLGSRVSYTSPVNFNESMITPRHRWFPYKEGFSPSFVTQFIHTHIPDDGDGVILDPFSGVGTTSLVAAQMGRKAVGLDVSPLSTFVAKTKALDLNKSQRNTFDAVLQSFRRSKLLIAYPAPEYETVVTYYEPQYLDALLRIRYFIEQIDCKKIKELFFLAYLSNLEIFSTHRKAGNGVKRKTKFNYGGNVSTPLNEVRLSIIQSLSMYLNDLISESINVRPEYKLASALDESSFESIPNIAGVITSPPYANCFDYSKIYLRELWLGDFFRQKADHKNFRNRSLRSHVHASWDERHFEYANDVMEISIRPVLEGQDLWSKKIPSMLSGYFKDISRVLDLISSKSDKGARVGMVVSNSFYGGIPIATDLLISHGAQRMGFKTVSIDVYRGMIPSSQQYKKIEDKYFMRESLVVLEKI